MGALSAAAARDASRGEGGRARASLLWVRWSNSCRLHKHMDKHHAHTKHPYIYAHTKQPYIHTQATIHTTFSSTSGVLCQHCWEHHPQLPPLRQRRRQLQTPAVIPASVHAGVHYIEPWPPTVETVVHYNLLTLQSE